MTILIPILAALIGALVYGFASNGKLAEMGRITFAVGTFWTVAELVGHSVSLLK